MKGSDLEFEEAVRLVRKFFPESTAFITQETGLDWDFFLGAMRAGDYYADHACDPMRESDAPDLGLALKGGLGGTNDEVYRRLLEHTRIVPTGRAVVVPDAIGRSEWSSENCPPFVCDSSRVSE
ncbi:MAG: hypothetical protein KDA88_19625, partial [Planctomycetaceae bacterium]|nr:hypothetical protein [Planctomycetaceae bacterium]